MDEVVIKTSDALVKHTQSGLLTMLTTNQMGNVQKLYEFLDRAQVDLTNFTAFFLTFIKQKVGDTKRQFF